MVHLSVKTQLGQTLVLDAEREDTIAALKSVILDMVPDMNCSASDMRLIYMGRSLDSLRTLGSHDMLDDGNTTYTLHALRPAPSAPALNAYVSSSATLFAATAASTAVTYSATARNHNHNSDPLAGTGPPPQISHYTARGGGGGGGGINSSSSSSTSAIGGGGSFPLTPLAPPPPPPSSSSSSSSSGYDIPPSHSQSDAAIARNLRVQLSICIAERDAARGEVNTLRERLAAAEERIATIASHFQVLGNIANAAHTAALSGDAASLHNIHAAAMAPGM
jgi:hypothetical protein